MNPPCNRALALALALSLGMAFAAGPSKPVAGAANRGASKVNEAQKAAVNALALSDAALASFGEDAASSLTDHLVAALAPTLREPEPGEATPTSLPPVLALAAPARWPAAKARELGIVIGTRATGLREWQVSTQRNARIVITSLDEGHSWSRRMASTHKRPREAAPSMSGPQPSGSDASGYEVGVAHIPKALDGIRDAWPAGRYAITALNFDWLSNTRIVELTGGPSSDATRAPTAPTAGLMDDPAGASLGEAGLVLQLPARAASAGGDPVVLHAAMNLPAAHLAFLPQLRQPGKSVVLGSLLLLRLDAEFPVQIELAIPLARALSDPKVIKTFALDLRAALREPLPKGSYQAYLVFGDTVAGPQPLTVE